jgi:hypothetical protein
MPLSGHGSQTCAVDQQVYPGSDQTRCLDDHRMLFAPVKGTVAFQQIEDVQGAPVYGEQSPRMANAPGLIMAGK